MVTQKENGVYYNEVQLKQILGVNHPYETKIFIPNEIFDELITCSEFKPKISNVKNKENVVNRYHKEANANHIAFAFSYVFLISYLYRYAKYHYKDNDDKEVFIDQDTIYKMCNTSPDSRGKHGVNYITKKDGLLERLGYIRKVKEYPIDFQLKDRFSEVVTDFNTQQPEHVDFILNDDYEVTYEVNGVELRYIQKSPYPKRTISYPVKAFHRFEEAEQDNYYNGYFIYPDYTTRIDINVFIHCMSIKELGTKGFYLYCFLKSKCDYYPAHEYTRSIRDMSHDTGLGKTTLVDLITTLEEYNMITNSHNFYVPNLPDGKKLPANRYTVIDTQYFSRTKKETEKRKVISVQTYEAMGGRYLGEKDNSVVIISEVDLPF